MAWIIYSVHYTSVNMLPEQNKEEEEEKGKVVGEGGEERKSD